MSWKQWLHSTHGAILRTPASLSQSSPSEQAIQTKAVERVMVRLDYYLENPAPGYAVMLYGPWGVGKSHWWTEYVRAHFPATNRKAITMSAAGLRTSEDLDRALFQASIKFVVPGLITESSSVLGRAALRWLKIEPKDIKLRAERTTDMTVVCIDDIERFGGKFDDLFGFIVNLVEADRLHVVLIADEGYATERFKKYGGFKEKIVGRSIAIKTDVMGFVLEEISGLRSPKSRKALELSAQYLVETMATKDIHNLRTVRSIVRELDGIIASLKTDGEEFRLRALISAVCFWRLSLAKDASNARLVREAFLNDDLGMAIAMQRISSSKSGSSAEKAKSPLFKLLEDTNFELDASEFPYSPSFVEYLFDRPTDFDALASDFEMLPSINPEGVNDDALTALQHYRRYTDEEIAVFIDKVTDDLTNQIYTSLDGVNHAFRTLNMMAMRRLTPYTQEELVESALASIHSYPLTTLTSSHYEDFGINTVPVDIRILDAMSALARRFDEEQKRIAHLSIVEWVFTGEGKSPDVGSDLDFSETDVKRFYGRLMEAGSSSAHRAATLFGARMQTSDISGFSDSEAHFAKSLRDLIRADLPASGKFTVLQSELARLAEVLTTFTEYLRRE